MSSKMTIDIWDIGDSDKVSICAYDAEGAWELPDYSAVDRKVAEKVIDDIKTGTSDAEIEENWTAIL